MWRNTLFLCLLQALVVSVSAQGITQCTVSIESKLEGESLKYGDL